MLWPAFYRALLHAHIRTHVHRIEHAQTRTCACPTMHSCMHTLPRMCIAWSICRLAPAHVLPCTRACTHWRIIQVVLPCRRVAIGSGVCFVCNQRASATMSFLFGPLHRELAENLLGSATSILKHQGGEFMSYVCMSM